MTQCAFKALSRKGGVILAIALCWNGIRDQSALSAEYNSKNIAQASFVSQVQQTDQKAEADRLFQQGLRQAQSNQFVDAIASLKAALALYRAIGDRTGEALVLMNQGLAYYYLAYFEDAITAYDQALPIFRAINSPNEEATTLMNRGIAYISLSRYREAISAFDEALPIFRTINNRNGEAQIRLNQGIIFASLNNFEDAIATFDLALPIFRQQGNLMDEARTLNNRGLASATLGRYETAIANYNQALALYRQLQDRLGEASTLMNRGIAYDELALPQDGIAAFTEALSIFRQFNDREGEAMALNNLGFSQFKARQFPQAEHSLRSAISIYETMRVERLSEADKILFFEKQSRSYRTLQATLIAQNQPETALTISEWGRSKALVEHLSQQLQPTIVTTRQAPNLKSLIQIAQTQKATLVEYSILYEGQKKQLYIWVIQPNGKLTFRQVEVGSVLPKQCASISQLIGNSRDSIGARSPNSDWLVVDTRAQKNPCVQSDAETNFKTLHTLLIDPISELLPTAPNQQVVFIPDSTLFLVPFAALKDAKGKFLIEKHTIRTSSSIQLLDKTRALKSRPRGHSALIVGNPLMPNDPTAAQPKQLPNLPNAEQEALAIAPFFNTKAITGRNGTKRTVLEQITTAKVIHLATHGSFYDRNGFKSWLALAPSANDSGILTAEEVAQLKLSADLVVLSACDTGRGRVTGEGVVGLSRSFIAAGVPSVVVSLWSVPDAPTAELMQEFYQQLQRNPDKAQALRQAMLKTLRSHPQPKNWAAFTLMGES